MSKYNNICNFLSPRFKINTSSDEFKTSQSITFTCEFNHANTLTSASFSNKRYKVPIDSFCVMCVKETQIKQKETDFIQTIMDKTGHTVRSVDFTTRRVEYQCGKCNETNISQTHCLLKNTGVCSQCQNEKHKLPFHIVKQTVEQHGMTLLLKEGEYTDNKQILPLVCRCGRPHQAVLSDIRKDKHCQECKKEKYKETCLEMYGVENAFQSKDVIQKGKETCLRKYGFEHAMRHPDIIHKSLQTAYHKIDYELPSGETVSLMGYEPIALKELYDEGYTEDQIRLVNVPTFLYHDETGKEHTYIPDMYIPHLHQIVEVKSVFTYNQKKDHNEAKFAQVVKDGYALLIMVYDRGGKRKVQDELR